VNNKEYIELVVKKRSELKSLRAIGRTQENLTPSAEFSIEFHLGEAVRAMERLERELDEEWNKEKPAPSGLQTGEGRE
jgi:hypothetical protein